MDVPVDFLQTVYIKTGKALEEMTDRRHSLRPKARQVLVLLDGVRTVRMLASAMAGLELPEIIKELETAGFIAPLTQSSPLQVDPPIEVITLTAVREELEIDPLALLETKLMMDEAIRENLGLLGADLKKQVAAIKDATGLRNIMARWHLALRESRKGADKADDLLLAAKDKAGWAEI